MRVSILFDEAKDRLGLKSDYALAKAMEERRESIPAMRSGKRAVPIKLAFWLAITLERDPALIVAELEAEREKNAERLAFWRSFLSRAAVTTLAVCTLGLLPLGHGANAQATNGGPKFTSDNQRFREMLFD